MSHFQHLEAIFRHLPDFINDYGLIAIFVVIMLESAGIPLPGETMLLTGAILAGSGKGPHLYWVIATAAVAAILGDNIGFWVGRRFGLRLLIRFGQYVRLDERKLKLGQYLFLRHGGKIVFFGRFVALLRTFAAVLAGANNYPAIRFFVFNALGGITWATLFGVAGYIFGRRVEAFLGPIGFGALAIAVVLAFFGWRFFKRHEERLADEAERALPGPLRERPTRRRRNDAERSGVRPDPNG